MALAEGWKEGANAGGDVLLSQGEGTMPGPCPYHSGAMLLGGGLADELLGLGKGVELIKAH